MFGNHPIITRLAAGEHKLCHCGESGDKPLCDNSLGHACSKAKTITLSQPKTVAICTCGSSKILPYCDGGHGYG